LEGLNIRTKGELIMHVVRYSNGIAVTALLAALGTASLAYASDNGRPSSAQIASAQQVSDLMVNVEQSRSRL
jgi:hypothetical protein